MNYLQICQEVALKSGTAGARGDTPSSVTGQTGQLLKIVKWVSQAWEKIQSSRRDWRFHETEFSGETVAGQQRYTAIEMGVSNRFGSWLATVNEDTTPFSIYKTADGRVSEQRLEFMPWRAFKSTFSIGEFQNQQPRFYSVTPDRKLLFHPTPDAAYTVSGMYRKAPQTLTVGGDIPECPEEFHRAITYQALVYLATDEEATFQAGEFQAEFIDLYNMLVEDQIQKPRLGGPLI